MKTQGNFLSLAVACLGLTLILPLQAEDERPKPAQPKKEDIELMPVQDRLERINIEMVRNRRNRSANGYNRDRVDRIQFTVKLTNQENQKEFTDLKAIFVVSVQNIVEKKRFMALMREEFPVKLGKGTSDRKMEWESPDKATAYYEGYSYEVGEEYDGWFFAIVDKDGKIVAHKASKESYNQNIAKIGWIKEGSWFDLQLDPTEPAYEGSRYYTNP